MSNPWSFLPLPSDPPVSAPVILTPLPDHAVLAVLGPDSQKFLQGQTTTDFREITPGHSRPGACCNLKGRASASFQAVPCPEGYLLVMDHGLVEATRALLQKYIVFSKARLSTPSIAVLGILGPQAATWLHSVFGDCPDAVGNVTEAGDVTLVRLHGENRYLALLADSGLPELWNRISPLASIGSVLDWRLAQIRAGESQVLAATREIFQPQELNFQILDGVSYNKGCYTGQEIVARLYFRGKLKNRVHRFSAPLSSPPQPGSFLTDREGRHAGQVVLAAPASGESVELLAVVRDDAVEGLSVEGANVALQILPLPYVIPAQE